MKNSAFHVIRSRKHHKKMIDVVKRSVKSKYSLVYLTTTKSYTSLEKSLQREKIKMDRIFFIDCVSDTLNISHEKEPDNCLFLESPKEITKISIVLNKVVKLLPGKKVILIDSLDVLMASNNEEVMGRFSDFIKNIMRRDDVETAFVALESDNDKDVAKIVQLFRHEVKNDN